MGKNYSRNNASGERKASDFYETCYCLTREFVIAEIIKGEGWLFPFLEEDAWLEPACGNGAIVKVLAEFGYTNIVSFDFMKDGIDFLVYPRHHPYMITNPPYSLAHEFILHAKEIIDDQFALLLPLTYLQGQRRYEEIFSDRDYPLKTVYVFTRYPMLGEPLREDGKIHTGMQAYAWFVWSKEYMGSPIIKWLDINKYVLRKGDV